MALTCAARDRYFNCFILKFVWRDGRFANRRMHRLHNQSMINFKGCGERDNCSLILTLSIGLEKYGRCHPKEKEIVLVSPCVPQVFPSPYPLPVGIIDKTEAEGNFFCPTL
jgi:hypothetical protein